MSKDRQTHAEDLAAMVARERPVPSDFRSITRVRCDDGMRMVVAFSAARPGDVVNYWSEGHPSGWAYAVVEKLDGDSVKVHVRNKKYVRSIRLELVKCFLRSLPLQTRSENG